LIQIANIELKITSDRFRANKFKIGLNAAKTNYILFGYFK